MRLWGRPRSLTRLWGKHIKFFTAESSNSIKFTQHLKFFDVGNTQARKCRGGSLFIVVGPTKVGTPVIRIIKHNLHVYCRWRWCRYRSGGRGELTGTVPVVCWVKVLVLRILIITLLIIFVEQPAALFPEFLVCRFLLYFRNKICYVRGEAGGSGNIKGATRPCLFGVHAHV